jgi:hypothetical protein
MLVTSDRIHSSNESSVVLKETDRYSLPTITISWLDGATILFGLTSSLSTIPLPSEIFRTPVQGCQNKCNGWCRETITLRCITLEVDFAGITQPIIWYLPTTLLHMHDGTDDEASFIVLLVNPLVFMLSYFYSAAIESTPAKNMHRSRYSNSHLKQNWLQRL